MKRPDNMLKICETISRQLKTLGVNQIRDTQSAVFYPHQGTYRNYQYNVKHDKSFINDIIYSDNKLHRAFAAQMLKGKEKFYITQIKGTKLKEWIAYQNNTKAFIDKYLYKTPSLSYYWYSLGRGALGVSCYSSLTKEEENLFKRFAKVSELSFCRYFEIQKAEVQAREEQIQLALEHVRTRTMAMHNSEEVTSATETMFEELKNLGIDSLRCGIVNIHLNRTFDVFGITKLSGSNKMSGFSFFGMDEHPMWQRWFESWKNKEEVFIAYMAGHEKEKYFDIINSHSNYLPQQIVNFPDSFFQAYYFNHGAVWAYSILQHSASEQDIMKRFAGLFNLTYTRFLDLQKAEAQAREAKIEAGLEKVPEL
jgi:hypothetical protein